MADKKISALTAATTPLAGTEVLPIVQSGATVKVSAANLTAGRAVSMSDLTVSSSNYVVANFTTSLTAVYVALNNSIASSYIIANGAEVSISPAAGGNTTFAVGDARITNGNLSLITSGKGIDFSATPGTGTSELLSDYEEGTFTATLTSATPPTTPPTTTARYTKIGRQVSVQIDFTNVDTTGGVGAMGITGLPFAASASSAYSSVGTVAKYQLGATVNVAAIPTAVPTTLEIVDASNTTSSAIVAGTGKYLFISITYTV